MYDGQQTGNYVQIQSLLRRAGVAGFAQYPEFTGKHQIGSFVYGPCGVSPEGRQVNRVGWQQVAIHSAEVWRENAFGDPVMTPLDGSAIFNAAQQDVRTGSAFGATLTVPNALASGFYSQLQAEVIFQDGSNHQRIVQFDIGGGETISFYGSGADVYIRHPEPAVVVPAGATAAELAAIVTATAGDPINPGMVLDSVISASYAACDGAIGRRVCRFTVSREVLIATPEVFKIPAGACEVMVYGEVDISLCTLRWLGSNVAGPQIVGLLPAAMVATSGAAAPIPGTARWLSVQVPADQVITVVFTLEY
jgi:hypothetical protein